MTAPRGWAVAVLLLSLPGTTGSAPSSAAPAPVTVARIAPDGSSTLRTLAPGEGLLDFRGPDGSGRTRSISTDGQRRVIVMLGPPPAAAALRARQDGLVAALASMAASLPAGTPRTVAMRRRFEVLLDGLALTVPEALVASLERMEGVTGVYEDARVEAVLEPGIERIGAPEVWSRWGVRGEGVRVGIVDTGIDHTHPAFGGGFGPGARIEGGWDFVHGDADPMDDHGHGTHVAGIVGADGGGLTGVAPGCHLLAYKVLDAQGYGNESDIIAALERCADPDQDPGTDDAVDVVNMSLGGGWPGGAMDQAVEEITRRGVVCVAAAGNWGAWSSVAEPGSAPGALTVGAVDATDTYAYFTSRGPVGQEYAIKPEVVAPGVDVLSAWPGGGTSTLSGTSMAAPHVAGAVALLKQLHPGWGPAAMKSALVTTAKEVAGGVYTVGAGRIQLARAAEAGLLVAPPLLSFGRMAPAGGLWVKAETLQVANVSAAELSVSAEQAGTLPVGTTLVLEPSAFTIAPGDTARLAATLSVDPALTPYPMEPPLAYETTLRLVVAGLPPEQAVHRVPCAFGMSVKVTADLLAGSGLGFGFQLLDDRGIAAMADNAHQGNAAFVRPGVYDLVADPYWAPPPSVLMREGVAVQGDLHLSLSPDEMSCDFRPETVDENGAPVPTDVGCWQLLHPSGYSHTWIGFPSPVAHLSPMSAKYRWSWSRLSADRHHRFFAYRGSHAGIAPGQGWTIAPAELLHTRYRFDLAGLGPLVAGVVETFELGSFGTMVIFYSDLDPGPVEHLVQDEWVSPLPPGPAHARGIGRFAMPAGAADLGLEGLALYGPMFRRGGLDSLRGVPIVLGGGKEPTVFEQRAGDVWVGHGPPVWVGRLMRAGDGVSVTGTGYNDGRAWQTPRGDRLAGPDPAYRVEYPSAPPDTGRLAMTGGAFYSWPALIPVRPGPATVVVRNDDGRIGDRPVRAEARMSLDVLRVDAEPPALAEWYVGADGAVADSIGAGAPSHGVLHLRFDPPESLAVLTLSCRTDTTSGWLPLPVRGGAGTYEATVPAGPSEWVSLRLVARDLAGNQLEFAQEPAYRVGPSAALRVGAPQARAHAGGLVLTWPIASGPPFEAHVLRRQDATPWRDRGATRLAVGGLVFEDDSVRAGERYGYRLALPDSTTAGEIWITAPVPAFALRGAGPNPAADRVQVRFALPDAAPARLEVFDVAGRRRVWRDVGALGAGEHTVDLRLGDVVDPGLYFIRLRRAGEVFTARVAVVR